MEDRGGKGAAGGGRGGGGGGLDADLLARIEEDEDEEEEAEDGATSSSYVAAHQQSSPNSVEVGDIPQCFSHFSWSVTDGKKLVCDLQGVWNATDGYTLTDPVVHYHRGRHKHGGTDKGQEGIKRFFETHVCSELCKRLALKPYVE